MQGLAACAQLRQLFVTMHGASACLTVGDLLPLTCLTALAELVFSCPHDRAIDSMYSDSEGEDDKDRSLNIHQWQVSSEQGHWVHAQCLRTMVSACRLVVRQWLWTCHHHGLEAQVKSVLDVMLGQQAAQHGQTLSSRMVPVTCVCAPQGCGPSTAVWLQLLEDCA